ncbi:ATP-grasp domain-containing protein [Desulfatiglans anilini]|uniref:ATP-grasp domain-containing protein n=1 Tax=Desulfatiglans anilini TaxID=90728 RepID=UPI00040C9193|nr:ATP-grasp domain-containing protein [Desulfatiglans anilini]
MGTLPDRSLAPTVLFTSVGRRVELLRAFRQAYKTLGFKSRIVAVDIDSLAPALKEADISYIIPRLSAPDFLATLLDICRRDRVRLILPLIDPDIPVLATHQQTIEATGARVAVVSKKASKIADDKWLTTNFFRSLGLDTPRSWLPDQTLCTSLDYPVFIKPRSGSAAKNTFKVHNNDELKFFSRYLPSPIIQEYLPGPEITSDVICDLSGDVLGVASRKRIEVRWGEVAKGVTIHNGAIIEACIKIAKALPAVGPITVQCMMKSGVPHFTEINARLGGGIPLGIAAGVNAPLWLLARLAGIQINIPKVGSYKTGLFMTRFDQSFFLSKEDHASLESCNF